MCLLLTYNSHFHKEKKSPQPLNASSMLMLIQSAGSLKAGILLANNIQDILEETGNLGGDKQIHSIALLP